MTAGEQELVTYEVRAVAGARPITVQSGTRTYTPARDIEVERRTAHDGSVFWTKTLPLAAGFAVAAYVEREPIEHECGGLGLFVTREADPEGFSWEWFIPDSGDVFLKLHGSGRIGVEYSVAAGTRELVSVRFLDDVVLRYREGACQELGVHTHEIVLSEGSTLRVAR